MVNTVKGIEQGEGACRQRPEAPFVIAWRTFWVPECFAGPLTTACSRLFLSSHCARSPWNPSCLFWFSPLASLGRSDLIFHRTTCPMAVSRAGVLLGLLRPIPHTPRAPLSHFPVLQEPATAAIPQPPSSSAVSRPEVTLCTIHRDRARQSHSSSPLPAPKFTHSHPHSPLVSQCCGIPSGF